MNIEEHAANTSRERISLDRGAKRKLHQARELLSLRGFALSDSDMVNAVLCESEPVDLLSAVLNHQVRSAGPLEDN